MLRVLRNITFAAIGAFLVVSLSKNIFSYKDKLAFYHENRREYENEKELNKELKSDLKKTEDYYVVEKQIREKLNLLQPGEVAVILPPITPTPTPTPIIVKSPSEQWYELFFK